jgi:hypothetical protein
MIDMNKQPSPAPALNVSRSPNYVQAALFVGIIGILGVLGLSYLRPNDDILVLSAISFSFTTGIYKLSKPNRRGCKAAIHTTW